jgi:cold-inducible RNA-binding protein
LVQIWSKMRPVLKESLVELPWALAQAPKSRTCPLQSPVPWVGIATARRSLALKKLYVGNLPFQATEEQLSSYFSQAGVTVANVTLVRDRFSGQPRGFGFVEVNSDEEAERAIQGLNGHDFMGRNIVVNEARPPAGGGGAGGGRGRGGFGGGGGGGRGGGGGGRGGGGGGRDRDRGDRGGDRGDRRW